MKTYYQNLTNEDEVIFADKGLGIEGWPKYVGSPAYYYSITDRNDYAVMLALTTARVVGCPATMHRLRAGL